MCGSLIVIIFRPKWATSFWSFSGLGNFVWSQVKYRLPSVCSISSQMTSIGIWCFSNPCRTLEEVSEWITCQCTTFKEMLPSNIVLIVVVPTALMVSDRPKLKSSDGSPEINWSDGDLPAEEAWNQWSPCIVWIYLSGLVQERRSHRRCLTQTSNGWSPLVDQLYQSRICWKISWPPSRRSSKRSNSCIAEHGIDRSRRYSVKTRHLPPQGSSLTSAELTIARNVPLTGMSLADTSDAHRFTNGCFWTDCLSIVREQSRRKWRRFRALPDIVHPLKLA